MSEQTNGGLPLGDGLKTWGERAPGFNLEKVASPLLIFSLERGDLLTQWEPYSWLRRLNKPVEMMWLTSEDAPHILVQPRHRYVSEQTTVDWFDFWLNEREDS